MKSPKPSPTVADVISCTSEDPPHPPRTPINSNVPVANSVSSNNRLPANHHRSRNGGTNMPLKTEHSPSEPFERQTVLMWGSTSNSNASSNRSPNNTPTSNTIYTDPMHPGSKTPMHLDEHHKWKGSNHQQKETTTTAAGIQVYQIAHLPDSHSDSYSSSPHHGHHQVGSSTVNHHSPQIHHHHHHQHHHQQQSQQPHHHGGADSANSISISNHHPIGSGCEVWSPSYSQYQYFTYHHAPQHASTQ